MIHFNSAIYYCEKRNELFIVSGFSVSRPIYLAPHIAIVDFVFLDGENDLVVVRYYEFLKMKFIGFLK